MLTEIIPGEHYIQEDGQEVVARLYDKGRYGWFICTDYVYGDRGSTGWLLWPSSTRNKNVPSDWDQTPIPGHYVRSETDPDKRKYNLVRLARQITPKQLSLFEL